jgi:hypothetical protein
MAIPIASVQPTTDSETQQTERTPGLRHEIREFWRQFFVSAFAPYRPEQHYMRGPGPAWRAKHGNAKPR